MRYFQEIINRPSYNILIFITFHCFLLIGCSDLSNELSESIPKPEVIIEHEMEEIPMILMDTFLIFDKMTYEEEVKVMSTAVNSRDFMQEVFGKAPSNNSIDSIFRKNPSQNTTELIIIDHQQQKAFRILDYMKSQDR